MYVFETRLKNTSYLIGTNLGQKVRPRRKTEKNKHVIIL